MDIEFFLPDFYANFKLIAFIADLMAEAPEVFYEDARISAAYGCFPGSIWNGGRVMLGSCTKQEMEMVVTELNKRNIAVRFTFTNPLLERYHLLDTFCNLSLEIACNGQNEVICNSPMLEEYIRNTYPGYRYISSTTKCLRDKTSVEAELEKDYSLVVLDSAFNNTDELFAMNHKDKIELLANHYCADDCPNRKAHYEAVGKSQLEFSEIDYPPCPNINRDFYQIMKNRSFLTTELIYGKYKDAGFTHFKIDGRAFRSYKVLESFVYYLAKPEKRDHLRHVLLKELYKF